jgi:hypothetical protein
VPSCATFGFSAPSDARGALLRARKRPRKFTSATLWEARLSDLQRLKALRWFGDPMPDFRDRWLFVAGVGMSWLAVPQVLRREEARAFRAGSGGGGLDRARDALETARHIPHGP